jgi:DNA-binding ferritin-like protein (Dps family)
VNKEIVVTDVKVVTKEVETQTFKLHENLVEIDKPFYKEVIVEVPKFISKDVISPVIKEVEVLKEVLKVVEKIKIEEKVVEVIVYKLVEEIIKVPKIQYIPTEVERVVWKDIPREKCKFCGKEA